MAWYALPRVLSRGSAFLLLPIYTRVLSPAEMGTAMVVLAVGGVLNLVVAPGIEATYMRWAYQASDDGGTRDQRTGTVAAIHAVLLVVGLAALMMFATPITAWLLPGVPPRPFYFLILATAGLTSLAAPRQTAWRAERRADRVAVFEGLYGALAIAAILTALLGFRLGAASLVVGDLAALVALSPWYFPWFVRELRRGWDRVLAPHVARVALVGLPLAVSSWALAALDRVLLNRFAGASEVGIYSAAYQIAAVTTFAAIILNKEWQPITFALARNPANGALTALARFWTETICVFLAFSSLLALYGRLIANVALGESYQAAAPIIPILVVVAVLRVARVFATNLSLAVGQTRDLVIESVASIALFSVANAALIPSLGALGAALAGVVAYVAGGAFLFSRSWNVLPVSRRIVIWGGILAVSVAIGMQDGATLLTHLAGLVLAALALRQAAAYWRFLGTVPAYAAAVV